MPVGKSIKPRELAGYSSEIPGLGEKRRWALYDRIVFAAAATVTGDQRFFSVQLGGGTPAKTLLDTNLRQAGQLPARQALEIWDIRIHPQLTVVTDDASIVAFHNLVDTFNALIYGAFFLFEQAQKTDLEIAPIAILAAGYGASGPVAESSSLVAAAGAGSGAAVLNNGHPSRAALWNLAPMPIVILPQRSFQVTVSFPTAVVLPAGVGMNLWCHLDGILHRSA